MDYVKGAESKITGNGLLNLATQRSSIAWIRNFNRVVDTAKENHRTLLKSGATSGKAPSQ